MLGGGIRLLERGAGRVLGADLAACNAYLGAADAAKKVACPVLLVVGEIDRMTSPAGARELGQELHRTRAPSPWRMPAT